MKKLVVVAPTFNEEDNIGSFITSVLSQEKDLAGWELAIVISDSHSTDRTAQFVQELASQYQNVHYLDVVKRGLGLGLSRGLDYAVKHLSADVLVTMEADLSNDPRQIPGFLKRLGRADLVVGSRYIAGGRVTNWSWWRKMLSRAANLVLMVCAGTLKIHEFTNLYRAFNQKTWVTVRSKVSIHTGWLFVPAFVFEALGEKLKVVEQPIVYYDRFGGRSKMHTLSYTKNLLHFALRYRWKSFYGSHS